MIIKLKGADFSANNINSLLNSWPITFYGRTLVTGTFTSSVSKGSTYTATFSVAENCTVDSVSITRGGTTISGATISGNTISISVPTTAESGPISITFNGSREDGGDVVDPTNYTFTINPTPSTATVTLTASGYTQSGNSITVASGTTVSWSVSADGYITRTGSWTITQNKTLDITLTEGSADDVPLESRVQYSYGTVNDTTGEWIEPTVKFYYGRLATLQTIQVQPGDSISIPEDAGYRFILVPYASVEGTGAPKYIDCNAADNSSNLKNWGYSYTFPEGSVPTTSGDNVSYPMYVRIILRVDDNGADTTIPFEAYRVVTYNVSADNSHIEPVSQDPPYQQGTMADLTGEIQTSPETPTYKTRVCNPDIFQVQSGDSISIPENAGYRFILGCYSDRNGTLTGDGSGLQYIDCNAADNSSNAKNWGYSYTFPEGNITSTTGQTISYPLYVRIAFRKDDNGANGEINAADFKTLVTYNVSADNPGIYWLI